MFELWTSLEFFLGTTLLLNGEETEAKSESYTSARTPS